MKYSIEFTTHFKRDLIEVVANGDQLDTKYRNHDLSGNYKGTRECHLEPDWLLVYEI